MSKLLIGLLFSVSLFAADIQIVSYETMKKTVDHSSKYTIVVLGNDHCPFCKITMESAKKLDSKYDRKTQFLYVNIERDEQAKIDYAITATPNILFFSPNGKLIEQKIGGLNEIGFSKKLDALLSK